MTNHEIEIFIRNFGITAPKRFKYLEIKKMRNSNDEKLGQEGREVSTRDQQD